MDRKIAGLIVLFFLGIMVSSFYFVPRIMGSSAPHQSENAGNSGTQSEEGGLSSSVLPGNTILPAANPKGIYYKDQVIALMYHEVLAKPDPKDPGALPLSKFEEQIKLMKANNFHWITMEQYADFILHHKPVPDNAVLMTFDDGYETFYTDAYPVLKKYHIPATSFLIVNTVSNPKHIGIPKLTWEQVQEMHKNGYDFYNHTFDSHMYEPINRSNSVQRAMLAFPIYLKNKNRRETVKEYEQRVTKDLTEANRILQEKLGDKMDILAFPYGAYSKPLLKICRKLGIDVTLTVKSGINGPSQTNGFRVNAGGMDNNPQTLIAMMMKGEEGVTPKMSGIAVSRSLYLQMGVLIMALAAVLFLRLLAGRTDNRYGRRLLFWKRGSMMSGFFKEEQGKINQGM